MATNPFDLYVTIAQISAVFAGFGSLASGLGQRRTGDDSTVDAMRLAVMLSASLSATLLGLLPAVLLALAVPEPMALRGSAMAALVAILSYVPLGVSRARKIRRVQGFSKGGAFANIVCTFGAFLVFFLCAVDLLEGRLQALYLVGLMGLLASSVVMFSRVMSSMLRPHNDGDDAY